MGLAQRVYFIAMAVIAAFDIAINLIGDGSKIVAELRFTANCGGELSGELNTVTNENTFDGEGDKEVGKLNASFKLSLTLGIFLKLEKKIGWTIVGVDKAVLELETKIEAQLN